MSVVRKIVSESKINAAAETYYKVFKNTISEIPKLCPNLIQKVEIHGGDWGAHGHGSIKTWNYTVDGKQEIFKERVEFNDEKFAMILIGLEGSMFEHYKTFKATFQVVPKGPDHCLAVNVLEYEKLDDGCPCPYKYLNFMNNMTKEIESHLK